MLVKFKQQLLSLYFTIQPWVDKFRLLKLFKLLINAEAILIVFLNDLELLKESLFVRELKQIERLYSFVHCLNLETNIQIEHFATGNLLDIFPSQDQLFLLAKD